MELRARGNLSTSLHFGIFMERAAIRALFIPAECVLSRNFENLPGVPECFLRSERSHVSGPRGIAFEGSPYLSQRAYRDCPFWISVHEKVPVAICACNKRDREKHRDTWYEPTELCAEPADWKPHPVQFRRVS